VGKLKTSGGCGPLSLVELAGHLDAQLENDDGREITGVTAITTPCADAVAFLENPEKTTVNIADFGALIVPATASALTTETPWLRVANARRAFARALELFYPEPVLAEGVHPRAVVAETVDCGIDVRVGALAVIGPECHIGDGTAIHPGAVIGAGVTIGSACTIFPNVVINPGCRIGNRVRIHAGTVVGSDGFGYVWDGKQHYKIPQVGNVIIEDDVEIGSQVAIDCGTVGATVIRRGAKIDNLVQIAHNVEVGEYALLVSQVGISGSTKVGSGAVLGGQVGVAGHLHIGAGTTIAAKSGVSKDVPAGQMMSGFPLRPHSEEKRLKAALARLPQALRRLARLERQHTENKK